MKTPRILILQWIFSFAFGFYFIVSFSVTSRAFFLVLKVQSSSPPVLMYFKFNFNWPPVASNTILPQWAPQDITAAWAQWLHQWSILLGCCSSNVYSGYVLKQITKNISLKTELLLSVLFGAEITRKLGIKPPPGSPFRVSEVVRFSLKLRVMCLWGLESSLLIIQITFKITWTWPAVGYDPCKQILEHPTANNPAFQSTPFRTGSFPKDAAGFW